MHPNKNSSASLLPSGLTSALARVGAAALFSVLALCGTASLAQTWPQRPVKFMVTLGPGAGADVTARLLAEHLSKPLGQPVVVENRPGADGVIAITAFLSARDDHLLLFTPTGSFTTHPYLLDKLTYDQNELVPVARVSNTIIGISAPVSQNINSLADLFALSRANLGKLNWASVTGSTDLVFSGYLKAAGLSMVKVPYKDNVLAANDLASGRIDAFLSAVVSVAPQVAAGKIRILALTNRERAPATPDIPTAAQAGFPALQFDGLAGLFSTSGMPAERRARIANEVRAVIAVPAIAAQIAATGQIVSPGSPAEFAASIDEQRAKFAVIAKALGIQAKQ